jgi:hypothetical protein
MSTQVNVQLSGADAAYFDRCARIRDLNRTSLVRRLLHAVARDMLVHRILNDKDHLREHRPGEPRYKGPAYGESEE